jgi:hypothetical protein
MDDYERRRLEAITARSAQLTGSAAVVAALAGIASQSPTTLVAIGLFVVAAGIGVAAQWPFNGIGLDPQVIIQNATGADPNATHQEIAKGLVEDIRTTRNAADARSLLNRVGLCVQVAALALILLAAVTK